MLRSNGESGTTILKNEAVAIGRSFHGPLTPRFRYPPEAYLASHKHVDTCPTMLLFAVYSLNVVTSAYGLNGTLLNVSSRNHKGSIVTKPRERSTKVVKLRGINGVGWFLLARYSSRLWVRGRRKVNNPWLCLGITMQCCLLAWVDYILYLPVL